MKNIISFAVIICCFLSCAFSKHSSASKWISLFDGKTLNGWKVGDNANTFSIENGTIAVNGNVAHLFYDGDVQQHQFKNFEFKAEVMTLPAPTPVFIFIHSFSKKAGRKKDMKYR